MNKKEIIDTLIKLLIDVRKAGGEEIYFGALATADDETTVGELIDDLIVLDTM
jgi:hypothetical protein